MKHLIWFLVLGLCVPGLSAQSLRFEGGHSHNDYHQKRPLTEALEHGMVSVEADIFLEHGQLLVGHSTNELRADRTLEKMYLGALQQRIAREQGHFQPILLLVDIKSGGRETYQALQPVLKKYASILSEYKNGRILQRQVTVVLSGSRPVDVLRAEKQRYAFIDGRLNGKDWNDSSSLIPLISDDWQKFFSWNGRGNMSESEFKKLAMMVQRCHHNGQLIRFWGTPNTPEVRSGYWKILKKANVDLIGTDCPACLEAYLKGK